MALFSKDKVLTVSARDYTRHQSPTMNPNKYDMKGVHSFRGIISDNNINNNIAESLESFLEQVPEGTDVVTDFKFQISSPESNVVYILYSGTALKPKPNKSTLEE